MFYIELKQKSNNKDIQDRLTSRLSNSKVKFEPPHPKDISVRYLNALIDQRYGHTKSFCFGKARCVKCIGDYPTINCPRREKSKDVKNVICEGNHPTNYKDCMVYKDLQRNFFPTLRRKVITLEP